VPIIQLDNMYIICRQSTTKNSQSYIKCLFITHNSLRRSVESQIPIHLIQYRLEGSLLLSPKTAIVTQKVRPNMSQEHGSLQRARKRAQSCAGLVRPEYTLVQEMYTNNY
jgi:hypothetical protein